MLRSSSDACCRTTSSDPRTGRSTQGPRRYSLQVPCCDLIEGEKVCTDWRIRLRSLSVKKTCVNWSRRSSFILWYATVKLKKRRISPPTISVVISERSNSSSSEIALQKNFPRHASVDGQSGVRHLGLDQPPTRLSVNWCLSRWIPSLSSSKGTSVVVSGQIQLPI